MIQMPISLNYRHDAIQQRCSAEHSAISKQQPLQQSHTYDMDEINNTQTILFKMLDDLLEIGRFFLLAVAPFLLFLAFGLISTIVIILLNKMIGYDFETVETNINKWGDFIWYCLLAWAAIVFSWALFDRYNAQRKEIAQQAVDREKERK